MDERIYYKHKIVKIFNNFGSIIKNTSSYFPQNLAEAISITISRLKIKDRNSKVYTIRDGLSSPGMRAGRLKEKFQTMHGFEFCVMIRLG